MRHQIKTAKKCSLHPTSRRLLLWGMRILCIAAFCTLCYIAYTPTLFFSCAKEMLHSLCISAVVLAGGTVIFDADLKKKEK